MGKRRVIAVRALAVALLLFFLCVVEGVAPYGVQRRISKRKRNRRNKNKKGMRYSKSVSTAQKFVGFNLGDGCSLSVAELGNRAAEVGVTHLKLFHTVATDIAVLSKFKVMAGLQNYQLNDFADAAKGYEKAVEYVNINIIPNPHVYAIAVGNEPFGEWHQGQYDTLVMDSLTNIQEALRNVGLSGKVSLVVPLDFASLYRVDFKDIISPILAFLRATKSTFLVNPYPDWPCKRDPIDISFCLGNATGPAVPGGPASMLAAQVSEAKKLLSELGYGDLELQVGETGWPTGDGHALSTPENQEVFTNSLLKYVREGGVSTYIFQLQDGYSDSLGVLRNPSGEPKFPLPNFF